MDCIFCKIVNGEIPANKVYEDDNVLAFNDISPAAPVHILFIPKSHVDSISAVDDFDVIKNIFSAIKKVAKDLGLETSGYRVVANTGSDGGQTVNHLHFHLLGKRELTWPPG